MYFTFEGFGENSTRCASSRYDAGAGNTRYNYYTARREEPLVFRVVSRER